MNKRNDRLLMIAIALIMMIGTTASADNWKNMDFRKQSSTTVWSRKGSSNWWNTGSWNYSGSSNWWDTGSWNYSGTQLNGVTHGGGINPYKRNHDRNENRGWDFGQANGRYDVTRQSADVRGNVSGSYSFNTASPAAGTRVRIVTDKAFAEGSGRHFGGYAGGGSTEKTYRYAPQKAHYGENMATTANMIAVKQSVSSSSSLSSSSDNAQMDEDDIIGQSRIGRKNRYEAADGPTGVAGEGEEVDGPLGDGLLPLALLALALAVWKMRK